MRSLLTRAAVLAAAMCGFARGILPGLPQPVSPDAPDGGAFPPGPISVQVDVHASSGPSNVNGVFEPGETVLVEPVWFNPNLSFSIDFYMTAMNFTGPPPAIYTIIDSGAHYSLAPALEPGAVAPCDDCYVMSLDDPAVRPALHWDAGFAEIPFAPPIEPKFWTLHIGESFADLPVTHPFYFYVEMLLHGGVTSGCGGGYCPDAPTTRDQMAVFLLKGKLGSAYLPPPATGTIFADVPAGSFAADWIENLYNHGIAAGCQATPPMFCPSLSVTRAQAAVLLLRTKHDPGYGPPPCTGIFGDVACAPTPAFAVDWIEQLFNEGITGGCGGGNFCPDAPVTRGQVAALVAKTFGLSF
jgi:hypothetical protein